MLVACSTHWKISEASLSKETLACRGGIVRVPNVKYNAKQLSLQPRLAWRGATQVHPHGYLPYQAIHLIYLSIFTKGPKQPLWLAWLYLWMSCMMQGFSSISLPDQNCMVKNAHLFADVP